MIGQSDFGTRKAPYAPVSALREFFDKIQKVSTPSRIDKQFLQKHGIAIKNEWALLSALKFLGVINDAGVPTAVYRNLQTTDRFQDTLRRLVEKAYEHLLADDGANMSLDELQNYFRVESSASQAKNAARFFKEVCRMAGIRGGYRPARESLRELDPEPAPSVEATEAPVRDDRPSAPASPTLLAAKARLLDKLPAPREEWSAAEYAALCDRFLAMLASLDTSAGS